MAIVRWDPFREMSDMQDRDGPARSATSTAAAAPTT